MPSGSTVYGIMGSTAGIPETVSVASGGEDVTVVVVVVVVFEPVGVIDAKGMITSGDAGGIEMFANRFGSLSGTGHTMGQVGRGSMHMTR